VGLHEAVCLETNFGIGEGGGEGDLGFVWKPEVKVEEEGTVVKLVVLGGPPGEVKDAVKVSSQEVVVNVEA
jgi:hypothetical protein